jgi:uncharacterized 2Fe-2S/4Fe-4S cluster protein (DUF4445 family)
MDYHIDFEPVGRRGECSPDHSLLECARQLGVELVNLCGGAGTCGRCQVQLLEGQLSDVTSSEREALTPQKLDDGYRLACKAYPRSDCKLRVPPASLTTPQRTQVEGREVPIEPQPVVQHVTLELSPPTMATEGKAEDLRDDETRVLDALHEQHGIEADRIDIDVLRQLSVRLREEDWHVQVAGRDGEITYVSSPTRSLLGIAVDLGTTKIAGYLVDLENGQTLAARGTMNPQIAYGEDVVARATRAQRSPEEARTFQGLIVDALSQLASDLCEEAGETPEQIVEAVVVGNTAMHHLFLRLPVGQLARSPYVPAVRDAIDMKARDAGLQLAPGAHLHLLSNIAGYVGADHVAMLLVTGMAQAKGVVLALDIGTNTEVCLAHEGQLISTSCASGPAFEGAHIKHGMRAAKGAIEYLELEEHDGGYQTHFQTIGDAPPVGLCGSGVLDALAELHRVGVVDDTGRMHEGPGVRTVNGVREFVLVEREDQGNDASITITQKDVRELQLAKGAMRAGIALLLEAEGLSEEAIEQVIIAGAFGSYIDVESAIAVGILPDLPRDRFRQVGNAAGMGAKLALLSAKKRREARELAKETRYLELTTAPNFKRIFAQATLL